MWHKENMNFEGFPMLLCTQAFGNAFSPIMNFRFLNMCFDSKDFSQYKTSRLIGVNDGGDGEKCLVSSYLQQMNTVWGMLQVHCSVGTRQQLGVVKKIQVFDWVCFGKDNQYNFKIQKWGNCAESFLKWIVNCLLNEDDLPRKNTSPMNMDYWTWVKWLFLPAKSRPTWQS